MKALGILAYLKKNDYIMDLLDKNEVIEAITELEALQLTVATFEAHIAEFQKSKSCDGCLLLNSRTCIYCSRKVSLTDYYQRNNND